MLRDGEGVEWITGGRKEIKVSFSDHTFISLDDQHSASTHYPGYPKPQLAWYRDAVPVRQLQESRMRVLTNGSLVISFLEERDSAMYQCFARSPAGEANTYTYLRVISK